jgi:hypothetical protein
VNFFLGTPLFFLLDVMSSSCSFKIKHMHCSYLMHGKLTQSFHGKVDIIPAWIPHPQRPIWPKTRTSTASAMQSQDHGNQEGFIISITSGRDAIRVTSSKYMWKLANRRSIYVRTFTYSRNLEEPSSSRGKSKAPSNSTAFFWISVRYHVNE